LVRQGVVPGDDRLNALVLVSPAAANIIVHLRGHVVAVRSLVTGGEPDVIREELQRTLVATQVEWPGTETGRVQFATWSEPLRAGVAELARGWGAAAEFLGNGSSPTPGASVCLDTARAGATPLNLLPDEWRERRRKAALRRTLIRGGVALGAVYVVALIVFVTLMLVQQARLSGVERKIRGLSAQYDGARTLHKTLVAMQKQLDTKYSALEVLRAVSVLMPENVKLNGYNFKRDDTVTLRAQAQTSALATEFISRLEKCELFAKVAAGSMRSEPATGLTKFDVTCTLKSAALVPATGAHGH